MLTIAGSVGAPKGQTPKGQGGDGAESPDRGFVDRHVEPRATATRPAQTRRRLIVLGALIVAAIFGVAGALMATQRAADLNETWRASDSLAQVLAEQTSRTMQPIDLTLREIQGRLSTAASDAPEPMTASDSRAVFDLLVERLKGLPQVDAIMVIGANGRLMNFSRGYPAAAIDVSGRDYYQYFSTHDDHALFISAPARSYLAGKWTLFLTRRINDQHGTFAGIVVAAVTLSYLEDFFRAVMPAKSAVTVLRRDGLILVHYPHTEDVVGKKLPAEAPWYSFLGPGGGSYLSPGYLGAVASLVSVRPLREFPLVIDVLTIQTEALSVWRRQVLWLLAGAMVASGFVAFLLRVFSTQYIRLTEQNAQLETGRQRLDAVLDNVSHGITLFDRDEKLVVWNRSFIELYTLSPHQIGAGHSLADILTSRLARGSFPDMTPAAYLERRKGLVAAGKSFEITDELRDGRTISMHYQPLSSGGWVVAHEEITERRRAQAALAFMACHDALTELPNRILFQERLEEAIAMTRRDGHCALLCLDLDGFKVVNDTLGHPVGDGLLRAVAARLSSNVREGDTVARLGGDEFAIILADLETPEQAAMLTERILMAFDEPYAVDGHRIKAETSIGISMAPRDGILPDTLLKDADVALYLAKAEGRGTYRFFEPEFHTYILQRRQLELELRNAVPAQDFALHYQPVLDLGSGRVTGFEALIRWHHPVRGMVSPAEFIPVAEETGLIIPIGAWVVHEACHEAAKWPDDIEIAVNLSPVQFKRGDLLMVVQAALETSGLAANRLELEITESTLLENSGDKRAILLQLRALGIRIAMDDFGTGYSSLSYLRSFPFTKIKIDQSFIRDLGTSKESAAIVGAIVGLARSLGMDTVAEGLETPQQLAMVRDQGCAQGQGYLFSRPCPADQVPALIRALQLFGTGNGMDISTTDLDAVLQLSTPAILVGARSQTFLAV